MLARFYHEPRLVNITLLVSLTFLFGGLRVQPDAILKRQMRFAALAVRDVSVIRRGRAHCHPHGVARSELLGASCTAS